MPEIDQICILCHGSGRMSHIANTSRARKGGNKNVVNSRKPGGRPMSERAQRGRRRITSADLAEAAIKEEGGVTGSTISAPPPNLLEGE